MTYQNIMIDRIKEMLMAVNCSAKFCPFGEKCNDNGNYCHEMIEWLNEQYI